MAKPLELFPENATVGAYSMPVLAQEYQNEYSDHHYHTLPIYTCICW